jgi:hypothetical protein
MNDEERQHHEQIRIAQCLKGFGGVACAARLAVRAARLCGAARPCTRQWSFRLDPADRAQFDRTVAAARTQLDDATFTAAWAAGRSLTVEQVIAEARDAGQCI